MGSSISGDGSPSRGGGKTHPGTMKNASKKTQKNAKKRKKTLAKTRLFRKILLEWATHVGFEKFFAFGNIGPYAVHMKH